MRFTADLARSLVLCAALLSGCARQATETPASAPAESAAKKDDAPSVMEEPAPESRTAAPPAPAAQLELAPTDAEGHAEPQTLAEAEQRLARAEKELDRLTLAEPLGADGSALAREPRRSTPGSAGAGAQAAPARKGERGRAESKAADSSPCETACKAFSSLERASQAVCRLDAPGGERCERARKIREAAARRVASCSCAG